MKRAKTVTGKLGGYDAAAGDIEIDPQCRRFRRSQTNFALQAVVERRAAVAKGIAVLLRWHSDGDEVRRGLPVGLQKQKTEKLAVHACGGARNRRQESNVLIVSILPAVFVNLTLRSNAHGRIKVAGMRKLPILVGLGGSAVAVVGDPQIEHEVPRPSRVLEVVDNLDVATLLSPRVTGRDAELCAHLMTGSTEERSKN